MIEALDQGWRRAQGLKRVTAEARDLFRRPLMPDATGLGTLIDPLAWMASSPAASASNMASREASLSLMKNRCPAPSTTWASLMQPPPTAWLASTRSGCRHHPARAFAPRR